MNNQKPFAKLLIEDFVRQRFNDDYNKALMEAQKLMAMAGIPYSKSNIAMELTHMLNEHSYTKGQRYEFYNKELYSEFLQMLKAKPVPMSLLQTFYLAKD